MPKIEEMWAWVSSDEGGEGILAAPIKEGVLSLPLVGADRDRMLSYARIAQQMADVFGIEVKLVRFTTRVDVERITPRVVTTDLPPMEDPADMPSDLPDRMRKVIDDALMAASREAALREHDERPE